MGLIPSTSHSDRSAMKRTFQAPLAHWTSLTMKVRDQFFEELPPLTPADLQRVVLALLSAVQSLPAAFLLPATARCGTLRSDLLRLELSLDSDDFDYDRVRPLLAAVLAGDLDALIWDRVYHAVRECTPPPRPIPSSIQQTLWSQNTSGFVNSSEFR